jgi:ABC-type nitrate/sulfonate/bicarbonate transport system permease component
VNLVGWLFVALIAVLAEAGVRLFDLHDSVAAPSAALGALGTELWSGELAGEIGSTLEAYLQGLALAIVLGVAAGVLLGTSRTLHDASSTLLEFLRPLPAVALIPLAILAFGLDTPMRRFVIAYAAVWPVLIATLYGVTGRDRMLDDVARTSGVGRAGMLVRVTLPGALPSIAAGIRLSASVALLVAVTVEFVVGLDGIGAYMERQQLAFRIPELYGAVLLVAAIGYAVNVGLRAAQRRAVFWAGEERAGSR